MINPDQPVRVIRNWKRNCYTILQNGVPKASAKQVRLADVEFRIRPSGRDRMLRERKRNVHAYAIGRLIDFTYPDEDRVLEKIHGRTVSYSPYGKAAFMDIESNTPVTVAETVHFGEDGVVYRAA